MKVLVATEKPFAAVAVDGMRKVIEEAGLEFELLEKYKSADELKAAAANAEAIIIRSDIINADILEAAPKLTTSTLRLQKPKAWWYKTHPARTQTQLPNWCSAWLLWQHATHTTAHQAPNCEENASDCRPTGKWAATWHA